MVKSFKNDWGPPEFVPADVTELAGPGLRIVTPLEVKVGDRIVVILKLSESKSHQLIKPAKNADLYSVFAESKRKRPSRIVEDIGVVRHTEAVQNGFSIAVELTGLNEANLSEMVRATNAASQRIRFERQLVPTDTKNKMKKQNDVYEAVVV